MRRTKRIALAVSAAAVALCGSGIHQVQAAGTAYTWQSLTGGTYNFVDTSNWNPTGTPDIGDSANLSVAMTGNLSVNLLATTPQSDPNLLPTGGQSVGSLILGTTGPAFTTDIGNANSSGGFLTLDNTGGVATTDSVGSGADLNPTITSGGIVGATNIISAPIKFTGPSNLTTSAAQITAASTNSLSLSGGIVVDNNTTTIITATQDQGVRNGVIRTLQVNLLGSNALNVGPITSGFSLTPVGTPTPPSPQPVPYTPTANIINALQFSARLDPSNPIASVVNSGNAVTQFPTATFGNINLNGTISDGKSVTSNGVKYNSKTSIIYGTTGLLTNQNSLTTFVLSGNNTYSGGSQLYRANLVLASDTALGTGSIKGGLNSDFGGMGYNLISDNDARTLSIPFGMSQNTTITGSNSLTWTGSWIQSNQRNLENLLPAGKTFTLTGTTPSSTANPNVTPPTFGTPLFAISTTDTSSSQSTISFDGPGTTVVSGRITNAPLVYSTDGSTIIDNGSLGSIAKNGDGILILSNSSSTTPNTYAQFSAADGGILDFTNVNAVGASNQIFANPGGAVGIDTGASTAGSILIPKIQATPIPSPGSLALASVDSSANFDFTGSAPGTTVNLSSVNTQGMSIGALQGGVTYTGTITPATALGYRLGGGGTLTLPNNNAVTGANNLTVTNGGTVALTGTNNFTGSTTIQANYIISLEQAAAANNGQTGISSLMNFFIPPGVLQPTVLAISSIADGASSIGNPSSAASNLVLQGGTLKVTGTGGTTNRLFTINPLGGTIDSSGSAPVVFSNTGAIVTSDVTATSLAIAPGSGNELTTIADASNLSVGMIITGSGIQPGTVITGIQANLNDIGASAGPAAGTPQPLNYNIFMSKNLLSESNYGTPGQNGADGTPLDTISFFNQNRTLTLSGTNSANNTVSGALSDSATGSLGINKTNTGTWLLSAGNSFSGNVLVNGGTLKIGSATALGFGGLTRSGQTTGTTTVSSGTLDLLGQTITEPLVLSGGTLGNSSNTAAGLNTGVAGVDITKAGSDLSLGSTLTFTGANTTPATAALSLGITVSTATGSNPQNGTILLSGGSGYHTGDILNVTGGGGSGAQIMVTGIAAGNSIGTYVVENPGSGYTSLPTGVTDISTLLSTITTPATLTAIDGHFVAAGITVTNPGSGYSSAPAVASTGSTTFTATAAVPTVTLSGFTNSGVGGSNGDISLPLAITGPGSLTKIGTNTVTLGSTNNYAGNTTVSQGNLKLGTAGSLGIGGATALGHAVGTTTATSGTVDLNGQTNVIEPLVLNGGTLGNSSATTASLGSGVAGISIASTGTDLPFSAATPTLTGGGGTGATASISLALTPATITLSGGNGFTAGDILAIKGGGVGGTDTGATLKVLTINTTGTGAKGAITSWTLLTPGSGFVSLPTGVAELTSTGTIFGQAFTAHNNTFTALSGTLTNAGTGYTSAPIVSVPTGTLSASAAISGLNLISQSGIGGSNGDINIPLNITGAAGFNKVGTDTVTLSAANSYAGPTNVNQGTLAVTTTGSIPGAVTVGTTGPGSTVGTLSFAPSTSGILVRNLTSLNIVNGTANELAAPTATQSTIRSVLVTPSLTVGAAGKLNLANNDLVLKSTPESSVRSLLAAGLNSPAGYWNGNGGIVSTSAAADTRFLTAIGYRQSDGSTFDTVSTTTADTLAKYTYYGDANLDGVVNGADYQQIDLGFGSGGTDWTHGDFNYDGVVNGSDFALIDNTFNQLTANNPGPLVIVASPASLLASPAVSAVPEPTTLGLLGIGAIGLLGRRRRRNA